MSAAAASAAAANGASSKKRKHVDSTPLLRDYQTPFTASDPTIVELLKGSSIPAPLHTESMLFLCAGLVHALPDVLCLVPGHSRFGDLIRDQLVSAASSTLYVNRHARVGDANVCILHLFNDTKASRVYVRTKQWLLRELLLFGHAESKDLVVPPECAPLYLQIFTPTTIKRLVHQKRFGPTLVDFKADDYHELKRQFVKRERQHMSAVHSPSIERAALHVFIRAYLYHVQTLFPPAYNFGLIERFMHAVYHVPDASATEWVQRGLASSAALRMGSCVSAVEQLAVKCREIIRRWRDSEYSQAESLSNELCKLPTFPQLQHVHPLSALLMTVACPPQPIPPVSLNAPMRIGGTVVDIEQVMTRVSLGQWMETRRLSQFKEHADHTGDQLIAIEFTDPRVSVRELRATLEQQLSWFPSVIHPALELRYAVVHYVHDSVYRIALVAPIGLIRACNLMSTLMLRLAGRDASKTQLRLSNTIAQSFFHVDRRLHYAAVLCRRWLAHTKRVAGATKIKYAWAEDMPSADLPVDSMTMDSKCSLDQYTRAWTGVHERLAYLETRCFSIRSDPRSPVPFPVKPDSTTQFELPAVYILDLQARHSHRLSLLTDVDSFCVRVPRLFNDSITPGDIRPLPSTLEYDRDAFLSREFRNAKWVRLGDGPLPRPPVVFPRQLPVSVSASAAAMATSPVALSEPEYVPSPPPPPPSVPVKSTITVLSSIGGDED